MRALILVAAALAASTLPSNHPPKTSKAEVWSEAVARFVTDPNFYRQVPLSQFKNRYLPLLGAEQLTYTPSGASAYGQNPDMGILFAYTSQQSLDRDKDVAIHKVGIEQLLLVLPRPGPDGREIYPILKAKLLNRLPKPLWHVQSQDKTGCHWRKGKTHYIISLELQNYSAAEAKLPGPGPYVVVEAAFEEGDSEEPE